MFETKVKPVFNSPEELIKDIRDGKMIILVDDEDRENEGDLVLAAEHTTPDLINFMAKEARGLICLALSPEQIERLQLPQMVRDDLNDSPNKTAFTVSVEAAEGVTTGISAQDRAHTVKVASDPNCKPFDLRMPGHIFPIRAQRGGVLRRAGHTEGSVDLASLAGLNPAAVICEVMNDDGSMARVPDLFKFAQKFKLKIGTIVDLIEFRLRRETLIEETFSTDLSTAHGDFKARVFRGKLDGVEHLVLQKGEILPDQLTTVRVQLDDYVRDMWVNLNTQGHSMSQSLKMISESQSGVFLLLRGNNRRQGLRHELKALSEHHKGMDPRDYGIGAQILKSIGAQKINLITNHPDRRVGLRAFDIEIVETLSLGSLSVGGPS